jgi:hypothetical protein
MMLGERIVLEGKVNHSELAMESPKELELLELATIRSFHSIEESLEDVVTLLNH